MASRTEPEVGLSGLAPASAKAQKVSRTQLPFSKTAKVQVRARAQEKLAKAAELRASQGPRAKAASPAPPTPGPSATVQIRSDFSQDVLTLIAGSAHAPLSSPSGLADISRPANAQTSSPSGPAKIILKFISDVTQVWGPAHAPTTSPSASTSASTELSTELYSCCVFRCRWGIRQNLA